MSMVDPYHTGTLLSLRYLCAHQLHTDIRQINCFHIADPYQITFCIDHFIQAVISGNIAVSRVEFSSGHGDCFSGLIYKCVVAAVRLPQPLLSRARREQQVNTQ